MKASPAKPTCYDKLQGILSDIVSNGQFNIWLNSKSALLDNRKPLDVILDGKCEDVIAAATTIAVRGYR